MMDIVKLLREAGDVYHDIARDMLQNEWKEHLAPHYTQRGDELKLAAAELEAQEPVAYTGSGSISAIKAGADGYIWGSSAPAHPVPLYLHPPTERAVPEGWQLVPVELTDKMMDAMYDIGIDEDDDDLQEIYKAMLAAAPGAGGE